MSATLELFERWKKAKGYETDTEAALRLGITKQTISNWRARDGNASPYVIEHMANDLREDFATLLIQAWTETHKDPADQKAVAKLVHRLGPAVIALAMLGPVSPSANAAAESITPYTLCAHRKHRRRGHSALLCIISVARSRRMRLMGGPSNRRTAAPWKHRLA